MNQTAELLNCVARNALTGEDATESLITEIFANFCVGK